MAQLNRPMRLVGAAVLCGAILAAAGATHAQSLDTNSASFNAGWGRLPGQENRIVDYSTRDANGNRVIVDGLILAGEDQSSFGGSSASGSAYAGVGAMGGSASAIGNNLTVVTQGNNNTVIVNSTQINNGNISAKTTLNGGGKSNGH